jgi:hypothetical protein
MQKGGFGHVGYKKRKERQIWSMSLSARRLQEQVFQLIINLHGPQVFENGQDTIFPKYDESGSTTTA